MSPAVKICGLTREEDAATASRYGAEYTGVIRAGGPRERPLETARRVLEAATGSKRVAVFGSQSLQQIVDEAAHLELDVIQLHGDPDAHVIADLRSHSRSRVWPVVRIEGSALPVNAKELASASGWLVLDAKVPGALGGTGTTLPWDRLRGDIDALRASVPDTHIVLAGGLRADNVALAMRIIEPDVVDVSSGVESNIGIKSADAIRQFISAVRNTSAPRVIDVG